MTISSSAISLPRPTPSGATKATDEKHAKLHKAAQQMEGSFVQEMFKAMRQTAPNDGPFGGGSGEDMFTGMMDEHVAADTPTQWHHGLSEAIYRQMSQAMQQQEARQSGQSQGQSTHEPVDSLK